MREPRPLLHDPDEHTGPGTLRTAARIFGLSVLVSSVVAGGYLLVNGRGTDSAGAATDAAPGVSSAPSARPVSATPAPAAPVATPSFAARVRSAVAKLPAGRLDATARRAALVNYDQQIGLQLGPNSSPASAAQSACKLLDGGTKPADLVTGVAQGASLTADQSRAFLLGATTLYCRTHATAFKF